MARSELGSRNPIYGVSDEFPAGITVAVVDGNPDSLNNLDTMLQSCQCDVVRFSTTEIAFHVLTLNKKRFNIVLIDVYSPHMGGVELLRKLRLEMDIPVIMMFEDDSDDVMTTAFTLGAWDCIKKPVIMEQLTNILCQVVDRLRMQNLEHSGTTNSCISVQKLPEEVGCSSAAVEGSQKSCKRSVEEETEAGECVDSYV